MKELDLEYIRSRVIEVMGALTFNRLVASVPETREKGRLRHWQEQLFETLTTVVGIRIEGIEAFLNVFADAKAVEIPRETISREEFLRRKTANPYDNFLGLEEIPHDWMAAAWEIDRVREELSYSIAREVSKTGSLCHTDEYLTFLSNSLSVERQLELFKYILHYAGRESEFRPEFEKAFPHCAPLLPPCQPPNDFADDDRHQGPTLDRLSDDIPF